MPAARGKLVGDADGDGRPDFYTQGPYESARRVACNDYDDPYSIPAISPVFVHHSRPDGTFSTVDEGAKRGVKGWCPAPQSVDVSALVGADPDRSSAKVAQAIICARLWGATAQAVIASMERDCRVWSDDESMPAATREAAGTCVKSFARQSRVCAHWMRALAKVDPPFTLQGK